MFNHLCQDQMPGLIINKLTFSLKKLTSEECAVVSVWNTNYFNLNEMSKLLAQIIDEKKVIKQFL